MAYGSPANPVSGTVITVAYAVTNLLDPIRWLRLLTGNADPPGSSYVVVSDSVSGTTWRKVPSDAIADGAVTTPKILDGQVTAPKLTSGAAVANIGYTPANRAGDSVGRFVFQGASGTGNNFNAADFINSSGGNSGVYVRFISGPSDSMTMGLFVGNSIWQLIDKNGTAALDLRNNAKLYRYGNEIWDTSTLNPSGITAGDTALLNGQPGSYYRARANHTGTQLAATISDLATAVTNFSGSLAGDVTGTQGATVVANKVPTGAIVMFRLAAEIPAGWTRESALDGRSPVGTTFSGVTLFGQTFDEATSYGTSWTPAGGVTLSDTLTVNNGTLGVSGIQPTATASEVVGATSATLFKNSVTHNHPAPSITGAIARAGSISISGTTAVWIHPSRGYNFARKN